jgi:hypothetical protein
MRFVEWEGRRGSNSSSRKKQGTWWEGIFPKWAEAVLSDGAGGKDILKIGQKEPLLLAVG